MTALAPKRPTEIRRYVFDYTRDLAGDAIAAYQLVVMGGQVGVVSSEQVGFAKIIALIGGGQDGATSSLEMQITTETGQLVIRDYSLLTANASNASGSLPSSTTKGQVMQMAMAAAGLSGSSYLAQPFTSTTTKGQIVNLAFEEITLAGYEFDATPTEQASALQRLDTLMSQSAGPGINLNFGYNFPQVIGGSTLADKSGVPDIAVDAVVCGLALSIASVIGKPLSPETQVRLKGSLTALRTAYAVDLRELDALMAQWASPGVNLDLGYNFPAAFGGSQITDPSGIPDYALKAVVLSLAVALPIADKTLAPTIPARLAMAMAALRASFAVIPAMRLPRSTIRGAGAKPWSTWWPFAGSLQSIVQTPGLGDLATQNLNFIVAENGEMIGA